MSIYEFLDACKSGNIKTVKRLINVVDPSWNDNMALEFAAAKDRLAVVELLLQDPRVDPSYPNNFALRRAAEYGHLKIVKRLLADPRVDPSGPGYPAIIFASIHGHTKVVEFMLQDPRVDPSIFDNEALILAGYTDIVELLVQHQYKIDQPKYLEMSGKIVRQ